MANVSYKSLDKVAGPLIFVKGVDNAAYGEMVEIKLENGERRQGQVLDTSQGLAVVQVFGQTLGLNTSGTTTTFLGETATLSVSDEMLGRVFDGLGNPKDNGPKIVSKEKFDLVGSSINPYSREEPSEFIQTGMSNIDGMNTLVRVKNYQSSQHPAYHITNLHHKLQDRHKFLARKKTFLLSLQQLELQVRRQTFSLNNLKRVVHLKELHYSLTYLLILQWSVYLLLDLH